MTAIKLSSLIVAASQPMLTNQMIFSNGTVEFESPKVKITPNTTRDDFIASALFAISRPLNQNAPWSRYSFEPITANGECLAGDICFCSAAIYSVGLCSIRPEFGASWNDASIEKERARHSFHTQLLQGLFQRPPDRGAEYGFSFPWGGVWALIDPKSGGCGILIKYVP